MKHLQTIDAIRFGLSVIAAMSAVAAPAQGLRLEPAWALLPFERDYLTTGTNQRGLSYNPVTGHLILVNRFGGISIHLLDAATGADLGTMDTNGLVNPGTFILSKVGVADDGAVYAANFGTIGSATPAFTVYRWENETSFPTIAYAGDPGEGNIQQWGTTFDVRGSGTNTQILVTSSTGTIAALLTTGDGVNFNLRVLTTDAAPGEMGNSVAFGRTNTFWAKSAGGPLVLLRYDLAAGTATTMDRYSITNFPATAGPLGVDATNGLLAAINVTTPDAVELWRLELPTGLALLSATNIGGDTANTLFMGAVDFGSGRVYALDSNNGLAAYNLLPDNAPVPPSMVLQPEAKTVFAGQNATFVASAAGASPLAYQWQLFGVDIVGATSSTLTLTNVDFLDEGDYTVVVSNGAGLVTSLPAHLTVLPLGVMTPLWSLAPGSRPYLTASGNNQRGMAYNPVTGHLVVVNRAGGVSVNLIDAATGADRGTMSTNGISGGTFALNMVGVADDGGVYAANFGSLPGTTTTVYRWAAESAEPTIAFQGDPTGGIENRQWGNALDVRGAGTNTQILLPSGNQAYVALLTTTNGTDYSPVLFTNVASGTIMEGAAFGAGDTFWAKSSTANVLYHYGMDFTNGVLVELAAYDSTLFDSAVKPIAVDATHNLLAGVAISTPDTIDLYDLRTAAPFQGPLLLQSVRAPADNANTLFRGAVDFGGGMLFALDTNNGISAFLLPFLNIGVVNGQVEVSWPAALAGFQLESRNDVAGGAWTPVAGVVSSGGRNAYTTAPGAGPRFFRLTK